MIEIELGKSMLATQHDDDDDDDYDVYKSINSFEKKWILFIKDIELK